MGKCVFYLILWCALNCGVVIIETTSLYRPLPPGYYAVRYRRDLENVKDPFDEQIYSENEKACLAKHMFLVNGSCYSIGSKGPCDKNENLLLTKPDDATNGPLKPVCKAKACLGSGEVWWPKLERCEQRSAIKADYCSGDDRMIAIDSFGDAVCTCASDKGEMANRNGCYEYYQRGPCKPKEVVTYDVATGYAVCSLDLCLRYNGGTKSSTKTKLYAPIDGKGSCYLFRSNDPCVNFGEQSRFVLDGKTHEPRCSISSTIELHVIDAPLRCRLDENNRCREQIMIQQEDRVSYLSQLKSQLRGKAEPKGRK